MQIAHARAHKALKSSFRCKSLPFISFYPLFYSFLEVVWCLFVSFYFPTLVSASTQLRKRFRSGRRSWWSPSARQRSSAPGHNVQRWPTCLKLRRATINRRATTWKHVKMSPLAAFASFPLTMCFDSVLLKLLYLFLEWTQALQACRREQGQSLLTCWRAVFMSTKEFVGLVCGCSSTIRVKTWNIFWALRCWQSLMSLVEHFECTLPCTSLLNHQHNIFASVSLRPFSSSELDFLACWKRCCSGLTFA